MQTKIKIFRVTNIVLYRQLLTEKAKLLFELLFVIKNSKKDSFNRNSEKYQMREVISSITRPKSGFNIMVVPV